MTEEFLVPRAEANEDLPRNASNFAQLTPLWFLTRAETGLADRIAIISGERRDTYRVFGQRCRRLASALSRRGIKRGDTVAILAPNIPAMLEAHFAVPMLGAVLCPINTRLDAAGVAYILRHSGTRAFLVDAELAPVGEAALALLDHPPQTIRIDEPAVAVAALADCPSYDALLNEADPCFTFSGPTDEWDSISLNYTSGTSGEPKGALLHHRGAYLNSLALIAAYQLSNEAVYLWTLPMFHCNGWCHTWAITAVGGTHVCLRRLDPLHVLELIDRHRVTNASGAPVVLSMLLQASTLTPRESKQRVSFVVGGATPAAPMLAKLDALNFDVRHGYGMTETYSLSIFCQWSSAWDDLPVDQRAEKLSRQGLRSYGIGELMVASSGTTNPVPADGVTLGEICLRGATVMKGYLKRPDETRAVFENDWFHTGDLAVVHPDGYVELKDRSKDIIISGGENISSLEIETVLLRHPAIAESAVVARPDPHWGETPCAFVTLNLGANVTSEELTSFCRQNLPRFKVPKHFVFVTLPKTSTGKVQKNLLRVEAAKT